MNATTKMLTMMGLIPAALFATMGCVQENDHRGDFTGEVCFEGFDNRIDISMISDGTLHLPIGRTRYRPYQQSSFGLLTDSPEDWYCDASMDVEVRSARVIEGADDGLAASVMDGMLNLQSHRPTQGRVRIVTAEGELDLDLNVEAIHRTAFRFEGQGEYGDVHYAVAGSFPSMRVTYRNDQGEQLFGDKAWYEQGAWSTTGVETRIFDGHYGTERWVSLKHLHINDEVGTYTFRPPGRLDGPTPVVEVVSSDEVVLKLCPEYFRSNADASCAEPGDTLGAEFFRVLNSNDIGFEIVMFDGAGHEVVGLPGDFRVSLPSGWEDLRTDDDLITRTDWWIDSDSAPEGAIRVTAFGREMRFMIDPSLAP
jgi:hypothetical protein